MARPGWIPVRVGELSDYGPASVTEEMRLAFAAGREKYISYSVLTLEVRPAVFEFLWKVRVSASDARVSP